MGHLFYFFGLIVFLTNINFLLEVFEYLRIKEWFNSFEKVTKKKPTVKDFKKGDLENYKKFNSVLAINSFWLFFGILSSSWKIFILLLIFNFLNGVLIKIIGEFRLISKILFLMKAIIITLSILILTINHFHLHLDLFGLLFRVFR
jgi:hypothetical protein